MEYKVTTIDEMSDGPAKERLEAIVSRSKRLREDINKLLSDFKTETGCEATGEIKNNVADIVGLVDLSKLL